ncbi:Probable choline kinase 2 [Linum grandiflorum]
MGVNNERKPAEERIPGEAKEMLKSLASKWEDVIDANALQVIPLKGAMTNEVFQIKWPTKTTSELSRKVVVRIYGAGVEVFFDRDDEIRTFEFMSKQGQGPRLLGRFTNGRIEEFIRARTLSAPDLHDSEITVLIAAKMKEFHGLDISGQKVVCLWEKLRNWLKVAKDMCSPDEAKAFRLDEIDEEITLLEKKLSVDQRIGFCHNDLQYGNIMIDEETRAITIIDYEYSSYNPVAFDIANHFCEMTADYHTDTPHVVDYSKYPGLEMRKRFVVAYLSSSAEKPSDKDVEQLLEDVENYTLGSHLFWGLWGIISEHVNKIDFDYLEYARQRFEQYWLKRSTLFTSTEAATPATATPTTASPAATPTEAANTNMTKTTTTAEAEDGPESGREDEAVVGGESRTAESAPRPGEEAGKGASSEQIPRKQGQAGVLRKFKRYLGFSNMFKKHSHHHGAKSADLQRPQDDDAAAKTPRV